VDIPTRLDLAAAQDEFKSWLQSQPSGSIVGLAGNDSDCPIARFLAKKSGRDVLITSVQWRFEGELLDDCVAVPLWVKEFILAVDELPDENVTREQALAILGGIRL
jgi:hypothetical protein